MDTPSPAATPQAVLCPFCGTAQFNKDRCSTCHKEFSERSRKEAQVEMGPWYVRNKANPHAAGMSYPMIKKWADSGVLTPKSVVRGPSTQQFWLMAKFAPGISHLVGFCFACPASASPNATHCASCGAPFKEYPRRNELGLRYKTQEEADAARQELRATAVSAKTGLRDDNPTDPHPLSTAGDSGYAMTVPEPRQAVVESDKPGEKPFVPGADLLKDLFG